VLRTAREELESGSRTAATCSQPEECSLPVVEFRRLKDLIYDHCGIKITDAKRTMLEARLRKRLRSLGFASFTQYCDYLFSHEGMEKEMTPMIDQVTTNKTDFFREPGHFEFLVRKVLPDLTRLKKTITVWSAGCSTGEEAYTLAMVLADFAETHRGIDFTVLATDISTRVLEKAKLAVYDEEIVAPVPPDMKKEYLLRSKNATQRRYRVAPELREHVKFRRLNLMDGDFGFREEIDIIFCRNVIIYFDKPTQERLLNKFCKCLSPHGYLFMGHSETLFGMNLPLTQIVPTVYRRLP
jgi:chemotaxis protein methyltransferase CheR